MKTIIVGVLCWGFTAVASGAMNVYVSNYQANTVEVIDVTSGVATGSIQVGPGPVDAVANTDGSSIYVLNAIGLSVSVIDGASQSVSAVIPLSNTLISAEDIAIHPRGHTLYITGINQYGQRVIYALNLDGQGVGSTTPVDTEPPCPGPTCREIMPTAPPCPACPMELSRGEFVP